MSLEDRLRAAQSAPPTVATRVEEAAAPAPRPAVEAAPRVYDISTARREEARRAELTRSQKAAAVTRYGAKSVTHNRTAKRVGMIAGITFLPVVFIPLGMTFWARNRIQNAAESIGRGVQKALNEQKAPEPMVRQELDNPMLRRQALINEQTALGRRRPLALESGERQIEQPTRDVSFDGADTWIDPPTDLWAKGRGTPAPVDTVDMPRVEERQLQERPELERDLKNVANSTKFTYALALRRAQAPTKDAALLQGAWEALGQMEKSYGGPTAVERLIDGDPSKVLRLGKDENGKAVPLTENQRLLADAITKHARVMLSQESGKPLVLNSQAAATAALARQAMKDLGENKPPAPEVDGPEMTAGSEKLLATAQETLAAMDRDQTLAQVNDVLPLAPAKDTLSRSRTVDTPGL